MTRTLTPLLFLFGTLLSACAPTLLGRTPHPAPLGETKVSLNAAYPVFLTELPPGACDRLPPQYPDEDPFFNDICYVPNVLMPYFLPQASLANLVFAHGVAPNTEINGTFGIGGPLLRVGGKTLLVEAPVAFAIDYGASAALFFNVGLDVGLLASYPLEGAEPYVGLRGFGTAHWRGIFPPGLTGAATLGVRVGNGPGAFFAELTLATTAFPGVLELGVQPTGFSLFPALGYEF